MGNETIEKTEKKIETPKPSSSNINMTDSQFKELLSTVMSTMSSPSTKKKGKTFTSCSARFSGIKQSSQVETFLAAVNVFKEVENMEDKNALAGLPLLLIEEAGIWWQGIKEDVKTWDKFTDRLRSAFSPKKPPYKIYQEIVETKQDSKTPTELFVAEKRALLAQLPKLGLNEQQQIDLIFGQIRFEIREKITRDDVIDFEGLLKQAKDIERNLTEKLESHSEILETDTQKPKERCKFCQLRGHTMSVCWKRIRQEQVKSKKSSKPGKSEVTSIASETSSDVKPKFSCYGCGEPGVVKSRCPKCADSKKVAVETVSFCALRTAEADVRQRPTISVRIADKNGTAHIDTCAKSSVASYELYKCLQEKNFVFKEEQMSITLADGIPKRQRVLTVKAPVTVYGRVISTSFIVFPNSRENRTLLGVGFIEDAMMVLNLAQMTFSFLDEPECVYELEPEPADMSRIIAGMMSNVIMPNDYSPDTPETNNRKQPIHGVSEDLPTSSSSSEKAEIKANPERKSDGPEVLIEFSSPPYKKEMLFNGHYPVVSHLHEDPRRSINEQEVAHSPHSASLFPSPKIDIGSLEVKTKSSGLTEEEHRCLKEILHKNEDVFKSHMKPTTRTEHVIDTGQNCPISVPPYRLSPPRVKVLKDEVEKMLVEKNEKCKFCCPSIKYLGHYITPKGLSTDPEKVSSITNMTVPRNVKHLLSFLQMCSRYRRFVANFAEVAEPLTRLTRKSVLWQWKDEQNTAFEKLKSLLATSPILAQADDSKPYIIKTDASGYAIGAVLVQGEGLDEHPVEYASRLLIPAEKNYSTTEREALAIIWAVNKFQGYVEGSPITVLTDHQALRWLMTLKSPSGRLARWALQLQSYDITIKYITPKLLMADCLKRAKEISEMKEEKRKEYVDQRRRKCPNYSLGDTVMVDSHPLSKASQGFSAKLAPRRDGPYIILRNHGPSSFHIADPKAPNTPVGLYHASALRPYRGPAGTTLPEPAQPIRRRGRPRKPTSSTALGVFSEKQRPVGRPKKTQSTPPANLSSSSGRLRRQRGRL